MTAIVAPTQGFRPFAAKELLDWWKRRAALITAPAMDGCRAAILRSHGACGGVGGSYFEKKAIGRSTPDTHRTPVTSAAIGPVSGI